MSQTLLVQQRPCPAFAFLCQRVQFLLSVPEIYFIIVRVILNWIVPIPWLFIANALELSLLY